MDMAGGDDTCTLLVQVDSFMDNAKTHLPSLLYVVYELLRVAETFFCLDSLDGYKTMSKVL